MERLEKRRTLVDSERLCASRFSRPGVFRALFLHIEKLGAADVDCCGIRLYMERKTKPLEQATDGSASMKQAMWFSSVCLREVITPDLEIETPELDRPQFHGTHCHGTHMSRRCLEITPRGG